MLGDRRSLSPNSVHASIIVCRSCMSPILADTWHPSHHLRHLLVHVDRDEVRLLML